MDSWNKVRPHYHSHEDLAQFEPLNTPLWVFDVDRHAMWWANSSALVFWRAESLKALLARDYSSDSETVRTRLRQVVESPTGTSRIQEIWTLYPEGVPTTVIADQQPVLIEGGRHAILIEASRVLDLQEDPDALRILEVARYSALMVSSFTMSGRLLTQNPTSLTYFGHPVNSSSRSDLAGRFIDETIAASILATVEREGHFEAEVAVCTTEGERTHQVLARKGRDPVTGEFVTVLNEEDMTEQAALRCHLQRLNNELELRVVERTLELREANEALTHEMSERKQAEEDLQANQTRLMDAIESINDGFIYYDSDARLVFCNAKYREFYPWIDDVLIPGARLEDVARTATERGQDAEETADVGRWVQDRLAEFSTGGEPHEQHLRDGRWLLCRESRTSDGGFVSIRTDITEIKATNAALRERETMLNAVIENVPVSLSLKDRKGRFTLVNPGFERQHGISAAEVLGKTFFDILPHEVAEDAATEDRLVLQSGETLRTDYSWPTQLGVQHELIFKFPLRPQDKGPITGLGVIALDVTEQKLGEIELRKNEARFRDMTANVPGIVYQFKIDAAGEPSFPYVSPAIKEILGIDATDAVADPSTWFDIIHPDDRPGLDASIEETQRTLEPWLWEGRMIYASGEAGWFRGSSTPRKQDDGSVLWTGLVRDITERKQAEAALRESEARYRELFDESPVGIWVEDWSPIKQMLDDLARGGVKDWRGYFNSHRDQLRAAYDLAKVLDISRATIELYRKESKEQLLQMSVGAVVIDEELDSFREMVLSFLAGQMSVDIETKDTAGDGTEIIVRYRLVMPPRYRDDWSRIIYAIDDVTERRKAEEALRESEKRLAQAQKLALIGHCVSDEIEGRLVSHSEVLDLIWGTPADEIFTNFAGFLDTVHPDDRERVKLVMEQRNKDRTDFEIDYRIVRPDGETRVVHEIAEPEFDKTGRLIRTVSTVQDITELKRVEEQLREAHKLKALGQLTGGVAHEFNNLLQGIVGSLYIIHQAIEHGVQDTDRAKQMIELAQRSAFGGKELTGRLLSYVGQHPVMPEFLDVGEFVRDAVNLLEPMLGETIEIDTQIADDFWPIKVDREQLELALLNLAINARDAMADGGRLTIGAANAHIDEAFAAKHPDSVTPGDYVKLAVADTGTGMSQDVKDQIFDPFFTTKEVGKGTGLGLSMVYGFVVRQSGGFVNITSAEGRGATVALYLPRAEAKTADAAQPAKGSTEPSTGAGTILVVEDDPAVLDTMAFMLADLGYTALKAKDGAEALTVLEQAGVIDLLLVDVILPGGMSGIELADTVRRANSATKVVVMSGYPDVEFYTTALSKAGARLLKKPFQPNELASAIEEALGSGSQRGA